MSKILIAVDDSKASKAAISTYHNMISDPDEAVLVHVERIGGRTLMTGMLGDAEMSTLKDMMKDTEYQRALDEKAARILSFYRDELSNGGSTNVRTVIRSGHPSDEILKVAEEEKVDLILVGNSGRKGLNRLVAGSVARDLQKRAKIPVLLPQRALACEEPYSWKDAYAAITVTTAIVLCLFLIGTILH